MVELAARDLPLTPDEVFKAVAAVHRRVKGSYAVVALIAALTGAIATIAIRRMRPRPR